MNGLNVSQGDSRITWKRIGISTGASQYVTDAVRTQNSHKIPPVLNSGVGRGSACASWRIVPTLTRHLKNVTITVRWGYGASWQTSREPLWQNETAPTRGGELAFTALKNSSKVKIVGHAQQMRPCASSEEPLEFTREKLKLINPEGDI